MVQSAFLTWAQSAATPLSIPQQDDDFSDLACIAEAIGDCKIVAIGESAHYLYEWNRWRARVFKYLALEHGFTTFVLESALVEGRVVHEYVAGAEHDWDDVARAINNVWGVWAEINDLIRWMRDWNLDPNSPYPLHFYSMDGSGSWAHGRYALDAILAYTRRVDAGLTRDIEQNLVEPIKQISLPNRTDFSAHQYRQVLGHISLLISRLQQGEQHFCTLAKVTQAQEEFAWALRSAEILRDVILAIAQTDADFEVGLREYWNVRDVSMAQSLRWIYEREGCDQGMVICAHNTHLQHYPVRTQRATSMGTYYRQRHGKESMLLIGSANERSVKDDPPRPDSNQATYAQVGLDCYFLDLRNAPAMGPARDWLAVERPDRSNLRYQPVCTGEAWDCLIFHRTVRHATVDRPPFMSSPPEPIPTRDWKSLAGRYHVYGFLAAKNTLDIDFIDGTLITSGEDDTSGELFPPYRCALDYCADGRFRWQAYPTILQLWEEAGEPKVIIETPGGARYRGERVGPLPSLD